MRGPVATIQSLTILVTLMACPPLASGADSHSELFSLVLSFERSMADLEPRMIDVGDDAIAYLERQGDGEVLVLIHGFAANKDNWVRFVRQLPPGLRIIALDLPGHGDSTFNPQNSYDATSLTRALADILEALNLEQFHLAGNSYGGWITTLYAAAYPEHVLSLSLIDSAGVVPPVASELQLKMLEGDNPLLVENPEDFERLMEFVFYRQPFLPWPFRPEFARIYSERAAINRKIWDDLSENLDDVVPLLGDLRMPVLVLWGDRDRVLHVSSVDVYREHLSDVRTIILSECGHSPIAERPAETAGYVTQFLAGELPNGLRLQAPSPSKMDVQFQRQHLEHSR